MRAEPTKQPKVGALLQHWRKARHLSQLALATEAEISPRHLCFVETGRAKPSREMILLLASALDVPLRERNAMLLAGGFAPVYSERHLDAPELAAVRSALDAILHQQEPFPAVVMNRQCLKLQMQPVMVQLLLLFLHSLFMHTVLKTLQLVLTQWI